MVTIKSNKHKVTLLYRSKRTFFTHCLIRDGSLPEIFAAIDLILVHSLRGKPIRPTSTVYSAVVRCLLSFLLLAIGKLVYRLPYCIDWFKTSVSQADNKTKRFPKQKPPQSHQYPPHTQMHSQILLNKVTLWKTLSVT